MRHLRTSAPARRALVAVLCAAATAAAVFAAAPSALAAVGPTTHDPIGSRVSFSASASGLTATGWSADPDSLSSNITVFAVIDGKTTAARTYTSLPNPSVTNKYGTGPTPAYTLAVPVGPGKHVVCIAADSIVHGVNTVLGCTGTPLGQSLTSADVAARSPRGAVTGYSASRTAVRYRGWATDPDYVSRRLLAVLYVDGNPAKTMHTTTTPTPRPTGAGSRSSFTITVPVISGSHVGCLWIVNIGLGRNTFLGCNAVDTRGRAGSGALPSPALNASVVAQATKHIGQPYVWGAQGPKSFDCSGLVVYSYAKAQRALKVATPLTVQRVSQAQALQARLIPAARAVPGDLVFTHDTEGDVYHVGIYLKPGVALAAIDYGYGVNYQNIWDPSATTYGSFTHT